MVVARTIPVYNNRMEGVAQTQLSKRPELHCAVKISSYRLRNIRLITCAIHSLERGKTRGKTRAPEITSKAASKAASGNETLYAGKAS